MLRRTVPRPVRVYLIAALLTAATFVEVQAQTCFAYVDGTPATPSVQCVQKNNLTASCNYGSLNSPNDCTSIPSSSAQSMLKMHEEWHQCFGAVGGPNPPAGRGQRWYAFHRQYEYDFNLWRMARGYNRIESVDWCPPQDTDSDGIDDTYTNLRVGHDGAGKMPGEHPENCGIGTGRPWNTDCHACIAFPACLFHAGGGPLLCPTAPSNSCSANAVTFPHSALEDFDNVDDVAKVLDDQFHGHMHGSIWVGDQLGPTCNPFVAGGSTAGCTYNGDTNTSRCSPRDPMFWRLHKALDDVVRAWQDIKAVDVVLIVDRSGSMSGADPSGSTKLQAALEAVTYFADLLEENRPDGQTNRVGIVSYSSSANLDLPLTAAGPGLLDPMGPFETAVNSIQTTGASGCTGIGGAIETALNELCPIGGDCRLNPATPPAGTNARKAILLLTDGLENVSPCLQTAGPTGATCSSQCFGSGLDYDKLDVTQLVAVGFGNAVSLNGDLLELLAERQGGIYSQNPGGPTDDLKKFYTMAFGQVTDEFIFTDPKGTMGPLDVVSDPVEYDACGNDQKITFTSGWQNRVPRGQLRLQVTTPSGDLVQGSGSGIQSNTDELWSYVRIPFPHKGQSTGTWRGHLIRPHLQFVNGFAPDAFSDREEGVRIVRRQIQRICPEGCKNVLLYQQGVLSRGGAYETALEIESQQGLIGNLVRAANPNEMRRRLEGRRWDLVVFANMGPDREEPYDRLFSDLVCNGQKAIITDVRQRFGGALLDCAGVARDGTRDWKTMLGDGRLVDGKVGMSNPGYTFATYGLRLRTGMQAWADGKKSGAIYANAARGDTVNWFLDVLGQGLGQLTPVNMRMEWTTSDVLRPSARILPSYVRAGGWDHVDARVEIEYPTVGIGSLLREYGVRDSLHMRGESVNRRAAALAGRTIPTKKLVVPLYDDGTHSDVEPQNAQWTGEATGLPMVDGTYKMRYIFDLTAAGCTVRREASHDVDVALAVDQDGSKTEYGSLDFDDGLLRGSVTITPADRLGNLLGPGADTDVSCKPSDYCRSVNMVDRLDGSYTVDLVTRANAGGVRLEAFDAHFDLSLPCETGCAALETLKLLPRTVVEHESAVGVLTLRSPANQHVVVHLSSSRPAIATVPDFVVVEPNQREVRFEIKANHGSQAREHVTISARTGDQVVSGKVIVRTPPGDRLRDNQHQHE